MHCKHYVERTFSRLVELGLVRRDVPFGESGRDGKRSLYRIADPFMRTWYRFVEPNRSRLEAGDFTPVERDIDARWPAHVGEAWEDLARSTLPALELHGRRWEVGQVFWGRDVEGKQLEIDLIAPAADDPGVVLVGEVKHRLRSGEIDRTLHDLRDRANRCPALAGRRVHVAVWALEGVPKRRPDVVESTRWLRSVEAAR